MTTALANNNLTASVICSLVFGSRDVEDLCLLIEFGFTSISLRGADCYSSRRPSCLPRAPRPILKQIGA